MIFNMSNYLMASSLSVSGSWSNTQFYNETPDITGLTFTLTYNDGTSKTVTPTSISPSVWGGVGTQTATFSYTENGVTVTTTKSATVVRKLSSLTIGGSWSNTQFYNEAPNPAGLTFTANYNNGTTESVVATLSTPSTWGGTGTQTATFSYTENGVTVSASKTASVVKKLISLTISGNWANTQLMGNAPNTAGLSFSANYNDGSYEAISATLTSPATWSVGTSSQTSTTQTATFSYTKNGITVTATKSAEVYRKLTSLTVGGSWTNSQYVSTAVDTTGLTFTATYNTGGTASVSPSVSPSSWSSTAGTQTATFTYTESGITQTATKDASVQVASIALTGASSRKIVFYSITGNLYTDSACTTKASIGVQYNNKTFYYKGSESKPTTKYVYMMVNGSEHGTNNAGNTDWTRSIQYAISYTEAQNLNSSNVMDAVTAMRNSERSVDDYKHEDDWGKYWIGRREVEYDWDDEPIGFRYYYSYFTNNASINSVLRTSTRGKIYAMLLGQSSL